MLSGVMSNWPSISVTFTCLTIALIAHRLGYSAGYHVKPELAALCQFAKFWLLVLASIAILVRWRSSTTLAQKVIRITLAVACVTPLFLSGFRENSGLRGFMTRMKQDIKPKALSVWLESAGGPNADSNALPVTREQFAQFAEAGGDYQMPRLYVSRIEKMLLWGSDLQTWAIVRSDEEDNGVKWKDKLLFRCIQK